MLPPVTLLEAETNPLVNKLPPVILPETETDDKVIELL